MLAYALIVLAVCFLIWTVIKDSEFMFRKARGLRHILTRNRPFRTGQFWGFCGSNSTVIIDSINKDDVIRYWCDLGHHTRTAEDLRDMVYRDRMYLILDSTEATEKEGGVVAYGT